jgi:hypothetical protein
MKKNKKAPVTRLAKAAAKIKVSKDVKDVEELAPFIQKKMEKGRKHIAVAGLPK